MIIPQLLWWLIIKILSNPANQAKNIDLESALNTQILSTMWTANRLSIRGQSRFPKAPSDLHRVEATVGDLDLVNYLNQTSELGWTKIQRKKSHSQLKLAAGPDKALANRESQAKWIPIPKNRLVQVTSVAKSTLDTPLLPEMEILALPGCSFFPGADKSIGMPNFGEAHEASIDGLSESFCLILVNLKRLANSIRLEKWMTENSWNDLYRDHVRRDKVCLFAAYCWIFGDGGLGPPSGDVSLSGF